jgi:hypothetical protein
MMHGHREKAASDGSEDCSLADKEEQGKRAAGLLVRMAKAADQLQLREQNPCRRECLFAQPPSIATSSLGDASSSRLIQASTIGEFKALDVVLRLLLRLARAAARSF